ncbi:MAG: bifunctional folylpolyglutamate synthase/dihydrofolate synthase [Oscillospiraceae bacterium]|nr:bifunctional folylpolyglutamate synthase/dihydrofolate synthase [Oscillospiraceae bacterium]
MTYQETMNYIHAVQWRGSKPGLSRTFALLSKLGDPHKRLKFVHVAGTNGKGSTCACIASILQASGYKVGLYTSPYITRFNERMQINGVSISDQALCTLAEQVRPQAESMEDKPTEFELITALALLWFARKQCDIVVLEVGLGGTLDSTNVIDCPEVAVITAIDLDHTGVLGSTVAEVAAAKAGIIKEGGTVVSYGQKPEADAVISAAAAERHANLIQPDWDSLVIRSLEPDCTVMDFGGLTQLRLPLLATYQPYNAAMAVTAAQCLREKGWHISKHDIRQGIETVRWPGRFELLRKNPPFLLDGSHNPHGIRATAESLALRYPGRKFVFLMGVMADKDVPAMIQAVAPLAQSFVTVTPDNPRAMPAEDLAALIGSVTHLPVTACDAIPVGVAAALEQSGAAGAVCALGSLYFSGQIRQAAMPLLAGENGDF